MEKILSHPQNIYHDAKYFKYKTDLIPKKKIIFIFWIFIIKCKHKP